MSARADLGRLCSRFPMLRYTKNYGLMPEQFGDGLGSAARVDGKEPATSSGHRSPSTTSRTRRRRSSRPLATFNLVEQWRRRGWHGRPLDDQSGAVQFVDHTVEREQPIIEGMELFNIRDARGGKMNGVGRFKSRVTSQHQSPRKVPKMLIDVSQQNVIIIEKISDSLIIDSACAVASKNFDQGDR